MGPVSPTQRTVSRSRLRVLALLCCAAATSLLAQQTAHDAAVQSPDLTATATVSGTVADTDGSAIPNAHVALENAESTATQTTTSDGHGVFSFGAVAEGRYIVRISAPNFASWKIKDVLVVHQGEAVTMPEVQLGVEAITTTVSAISIEDLAEQQITVEEHQRILGVLPNFYVSYLPDAAPLTRRQKFKLAVHVSVDPMTYFTTGVSAGIEQWQGDFSGYGQEFSGYAKRYGAGYGDRLSSTFLGAALLLHVRCCTRDPRATSTAATGPSSSARSTPSPRSPCARATTATGSQTTPIFSAILVRRESLRSTIRRTIDTACK